MRAASILSCLLAPSLVLGLLDPKIKAKGKKYFGTAADPNTLSNTDDQTIITSDYGCITPENRYIRNPDVGISMTDKKKTV